MTPRLTDLLGRLRVVEDLEESARVWALAGGRGSLPAEFGTTCELCREWCWRAGLAADREDLSEDDGADVWARITLAEEGVARARHWVHLGGLTEAALVALSRTGAIVAPMAAQVLESRGVRGASHGGR